MSVTIGSASCSTVMPAHSGHAAVADSLIRNWPMAPANKLSPVKTLESASASGAASDAANRILPRSDRQHQRERARFLIVYGQHFFSTSWANAENLVPFSSTTL